MTSWLIKQSIYSWLLSVAIRCWYLHQKLFLNGDWILHQYFKIIVMLPYYSLGSDCSACCCSFAVGSEWLQVAGWLPDRHQLSSRQSHLFTQPSIMWKQGLPLAPGFPRRDSTTMRVLQQLTAQWRSESNLCGRYFSVKQYNNIVIITVTETPTGLREQSFIFWTLASADFGPWPRNLKSLVSLDGYSLKIDRFFFPFFVENYLP